jgi:succinoglycan biosynthesis protein ExoM
MNGCETLFGKRGDAVAADNDMQHITVCICTFKRPQLLERLLHELVAQRTNGTFSYSIVVVDNDSGRSAETTVRSFQQSSGLDVQYCIEARQNIALARNRAVEYAKGDFIAFLDDDEFPLNDWLLTLHAACVRYRADGALGPVKPHFEEQSPDWIRRGRLCERTSFSTGTIMRATDSRTGNVLMKREIFDDPQNRFDPQYGRTGGEDVWFFVNVMRKGRVFVWCDEAVAFETVPPERWKASYYIKRFIRIGGLTGEEQRTKGLPGRGLARVIAVFCAYAVLLPFTVFIGKHMFMRYLVKCAYNMALLSGYFGLVLIRNRDD